MQVVPEMFVKTIWTYVLPAAPWLIPVFAPSERVAHGWGPFAAGCELLGAGLLGAGLLAGALLGACVGEMLGETRVGLGLGAGDAEEQAVTSAIKDTSAAALARPAVRNDEVIEGDPYLCRWMLTCQLRRCQGRRGWAWLARQ